MGSIDLPQVEPRGNKSLEEYVQYLANVVAVQQEEILNLLEGRISTNNVREIAGWLVSKNLLQSKDKDVGMSTEDTAADDIRFFAGPDGAGGWKFYVTKGGKMFAIDGSFKGNIDASEITGSTIIGSEIKTSETAYPRIELSTLGTFFKALGSASKSIEISVSTAGTPGIFFKDDAGTALIDISSGIFDLLSTIAMAISAPNVSAGGDWTFELPMNADITGNAASANYADRAGTAAAADGLAPSGTIAWGQVDKAGSSLSQIQTRNLADLTQTAAYRTVTDGDKTTWNAKWGDTTTNSRSAVRAYQSANQAFSAGVSAKVQYQTEEYDHLSEYSTTNYQFTAAKAGIYLVNVSLFFDLPAGTRVILNLFKNGVQIKRLSDIITDGSYLAQASAQVKLSANDILEIYAYCSSAVTTQGTTSDLSVLEITQIA